MSSWSEFRKYIDSLNVVKYFEQKPTKEDSGEPSSEVIKSIDLEKANIFHVHSERPRFYKITLQQTYENSEFLEILEDLFREKELDFSIAIYSSASISEESIKDIFCEAMNKYKELNGL